MNKVGCFIVWDTDLILESLSFYLKLEPIINTLDYSLEKVVGFVDWLEA